MFEIAVLSVSLVIQLAAAYLSIRLIPTTGHKLAWIAFAAALLLMSARRGISIFDRLQAWPATEANVLAELVALIISILILLGVMNIRPIFEAQRMVHRLESRIGRLLNSSLHEIYIYSADTLLFSQVNRGALVNLGYSHEEMENMTPVDLKTEFTEKSFRQLIEPLLREETERIRFATSHRRKDGTEYPVEVDLQMFREDTNRVFAAIINDVSGREQAKKALAEREERFRSLIENVNDLVTVLRPNGEVVYQSPAVERVLGHVASQRIGRSAFELIHPDDHEAVGKALASLTEDTQSPLRLVYRLRNADAQWRVFEAVGRPYKKSEEEQPEIIVTQRDITERLQSEERLRQAQRMETMGTLAGGIAHDFNNLLMPMLGHSELLRTRLSEAGDLKAIEDVITAIQRAQEMVSQIVMFSRQYEEKRKPLYLPDVVDEVAGLMRASLPASIKLVTRLGSQVGNILADRTQIFQVITNLCNNAEHAMQSEGGVITAAVENRWVDSKDISDLSKLQPGEYVHLTVSDTGHGMDNETLGQIFEPFFTTKKQSGGTGLGLSVAHRIVVAHGGDLTAESATGDGACFHAWFPRVAEAARLDAEVLKSTRGSERILVVDDEESVGIVLVQMLRSLGYEVTRFQEPLKALERIRKNCDEIDLIITDQTMPSMTGLELAAEIHECRNDLPVMIMSGFSHTLDSVAKTAPGIACILSKPFGTEALSRSIREVLAGDLKKDS